MLKITPGEYSIRSFAGHTFSAKVTTQIAGPKQTLDLKGIQKYNKLADYA